MFDADRKYQERTFQIRHDLEREARLEAAMERRNGAVQWTPEQRKILRSHMPKEQGSQ